MTERVNEKDEAALTQDEYVEWCHEAIRQVVDERNEAETQRDQALAEVERLRAALERTANHTLDDQCDGECAWTLVELARQALADNTREASDG